MHVSGDNASENKICNGIAPKMTRESTGRKKVYTLTFHDVPNIGAVLQAYALQKYISSIGFDCEVVNYKPFYHEIGLLKPYKGLRRNIDKFKLLRNVRGFASQNLPQTTGVTRSVSQLSALRDAYAFVTGSDQIWNPDLTGGKPDRAFFLDFPTDALKIAYAASSGGTRISAMGHNVSKYVAAYDAVSVRERFLEEDLASSRIRTDATTVLDPTYLIDDYDEIMSDQVDLPEQYIVSYEVSSSASRSKFVAAVQAAKLRYNLPVVHLGINPIPNCDIDLSPPTPGTWLSTIRNASFSITNSFHGLLFSANFNRHFQYVPHIEDGKNARPRNFLEILGPGTTGLNDNADTSNGDLTISVNFRDASPWLLAEIEKSRTFIRKSLKIE